MTTWYHMHIVKRCNRSLDSALAFSLDVMVGKPCMANVEKQCIWELCSSTLTSCDILWHLMTMSWLTICESVGQSPAWLLSVQPLTGSPPAPDSRISTWNQKSYCMFLKYLHDLVNLVPASTTWPQESCCWALLNCVCSPANSKRSLRSRHLDVFSTSGNL